MSEIEMRLAPAEVLLVALASALGADQLAEAERRLDGMADLAGGDDRLAVLDALALQRDIRLMVPAGPPDLNRSAAVQLARLLARRPGG